MRNRLGFDAAVIRPVYFVDIDFASGPFRANSSDRDIVYNTFTYTGVGNLGQISETSTTTGTAATGIKLTLTSIPQAQAANISEENIRNRKVVVSIALLDAANAILTAPFVFFSGNMDSMTMDIGRVITVQCSATSKLINWARAINSRYTNEEQQSKFPGDIGFQFVNKLVTLKLQWGTGAS